MRFAALFFLTLLCWCESPLRAQPLGLPSNLDPGDRASWYAALHWPQDCEDRHAFTDPGSAGLKFIYLAPQRYIVEVTCALGAYQGSKIFFIWNEAAPPPVATKLSFPIYENSSRTRKAMVTELWGTAFFQPEHGLLVIFNRFRGLGDCGWLAVYKVGLGGVALQEFRTKPVCDGNGADHPERWKRVKSDMADTSSKRRRSHRP